ncbi:pilus assembly protein TadG-related protein [Sinomonas susongensis]|uniref:pilus assembly protein TadG-related protein n=1 Tax=Sinomonas susongensis TaxID=1324851 RepID=UPI001FEA0826|nr:pilus assembly protein TadG-related protein [Sinomonas susongensis]
MNAVQRSCGHAECEQESGQILLLLVGFAVLCLLVASVVVGVSAVHLERQRLLSAADGAAQASADSFTFADALAGSGPPGAVLSSERVRRAAVAFLRETGAEERFESFSVGSAVGSPDGRSAQVTLGAVVRLPLISILLPDAPRIEVTSIARARLGR